MDLLTVSTFEHVRDVHPVHHRVSWETLVQVLTTFRPHQADKYAAPCWSPASYGPSDTRQASKVLEVSVLALDLDDGTTLDEALGYFDGFACVAHTSWSHRGDAPRARAVVRLSHPIAGDVWPHLYRAVLRQVGLDADPKCCDASRIFILPCVGLGGPHEARAVEGAAMDLRPEASRIRKRLQREAKERAVRRQLHQRRRRRMPRQDARRDALRHDPTARQALGEQLRGRIVGDKVRKVRCPGCGRHSVWWLVDPEKAHTARCNHEESCGWYGQLWELER